MANRNLTKAKNAKNDEFYTQYHDIEKEIAAYLEYDPDVFSGKTARKGLASILFIDVAAVFHPVGAKCFRPVNSSKTRWEKIRIEIWRINGEYNARLTDI